MRLRNSLARNHRARLAARGCSGQRHAVQRAEGFERQLSLWRSGDRPGWESQPGSLSRAGPRNNSHEFSPAQPRQSARTSNVNRMKRAFLFLLLAIFALPSCETAHNAAVATFRVLDAPHVYIRRQLGVDEEPQQTTTTTTTTTETNAPPNGAVSPQPPERRVVVSERSHEPEPESRPAPAATPHVAGTSSTAGAPRTTEPKVSPTPRAALSEKSDLPFAKPVPGKPGYVFSPFDKNGGYVDVTGFSPGSKVKDPYSGKIFLVP
jgi:hypothetical protein